MDGDCLAQVRLSFKARLQPRDPMQSPFMKAPVFPGCQPVTLARSVTLAKR